MSTKADESAPLMVSKYAIRPAAPAPGLLAVFVAAVACCAALAAPPAAEPAAAAQVPPAAHSAQGGVTHAQAGPAPAQAGSAPAVATASRAQGEANAAKIDRLAILIQERNAIAGRLRTAEAASDSAATARAHGDLQAIEREIALVARQPATPTTTGAPPAAAASGAKPVSAAKAANPESQKPDGPKTYEPWDIFKNFGKGN